MAYEGCDEGQSPSGRTKGASRDKSVKAYRGLRQGTLSVKARVVVVTTEGTLKESMSDAGSRRAKRDHNSRPAVHISSQISSIHIPQCLTVLLQCVHR